MPGHTRATSQGFSRVLTVIYGHAHRTASQDADRGSYVDVRFALCPPPGRYAHGLPCRITDITSVGGTGGHAYLWVSVLPFLIIVAILVLRAGFARVSFLIWPTDRQLVAGAACANLIVVLTAFLTKSGLVSVRSHRIPASSQLSIIWESGAYIALGIAAAAAATAVLNALMASHHTDNDHARGATRP